MDKPTPIKKPRPLTTKQKKFIKAKLEGKTGVAAAQEAYGVDYNSGKVIASNNLTKVNIQEALDAVYQKRGITLEKIVEPFALALDANKVVQVEGDFYETDVPDHTVRMTAGKNLAQFIGIGKQASEGGNTTNLNFINISRNDKGEYGL